MFYALVFLFLSIFVVKAQDTGSIYVIGDVEISGDFGNAQMVKVPTTAHKHIAQSEKKTTKTKRLAKQEIKVPIKKVQSVEQFIKTPKTNDAFSIASSSSLYKGTNTQHYSKIIAPAEKKIIKLFQYRCTDKPIYLAVFTDISFTKLRNKSPLVFLL